MYSTNLFLTLRINEIPARGKKAWSNGQILIKEYLLKKHHLTFCFPKIAYIPFYILRNREINQ